MQREVEVVDDPEPVDVELVEHARILARVADITVEPVRIARESELLLDPLEEPAASSRRTNRAGRFEARIRMRVPTATPSVSLPSAESSPSSSRITWSVTTCPALSTNERSKTMCAAIGVSTRQGTSGVTIGPRALNEYAVEPVGVATITPSAEKVVT